MKLVKRIGYKLIVVMCIIATFCTFIASTPVEASKVNDSDFYYSGTDKGSYTVNKGFLQIFAETMSSVLDYLFGVISYVVRIPFIGLTALAEYALTKIFVAASGEKVILDDVSSTGLFQTDSWITVDAIFFNHIPLLDINVFNFDGIQGYDEQGKPIKAETEEHEAPMIIYTENSHEEAIGTIVQGEKKDFKAAGESEEDKSLVIILKETIAGWYYTLRTISIMVMLILLIYIGIQLAIKSSTTDKAVYKKMLTDWVVGMILVFSIHYIMLFVITLNEVAVETIGKLRTGTTPLYVYEYGLKERIEDPLTNDELEYTLYDEVKTRAYDAKMTVGVTGMIMYMTLVYYAWKFSFIYLKRYLTVAVLVIMAPLIAVSYAYNKVTSGKATIFSKWFKEFFFIVMLQTIHALIYVTFVQTALAISLSSISGFILVMILFNFMSKAEDLFRKIFNIEGNLTNDIAKGQGIQATLQGLRSAVTTMAVGNVAKNYTKGVAKIATKPITATATLGFGAVMKNRAKRLDKKAKALGNPNITNSEEMIAYERNKKVKALEYGNILKQLKSGDLKISDLENSVNSLREGQELYDDTGNYIAKVDKSYISNKRLQLEMIKNLNSGVKKTNTNGVEDYDTSERDELIKTYDKMHTKFGKNKKLKKIRIYAGEKWADIFDPNNYIERVKDKSGNIIGYEKVKTQRENGKVTDSVGKRVAEKLTFKNFANLNGQEKENIKKQIELIKNITFGFSGLVAGLSTVVAEPVAGMALLATGISNSSKALSREGKQKRKMLNGFKMDSSGKYTFNKFAGKSEHTIAEGAKSIARAQVLDLVTAKAQQDAVIKGRIRKNHPKLAAICSGTSKATEFLTIGTVGIIGGAPVVVAAGGAASAVKLTGNILGNVTDNIWSTYHDTVRSAAKSNSKDFETVSKLGTDDYLDMFANQYFQLESEEYKKDAERHAEKFGEQYAIILANMKEEIDRKEKEELLRDTAYEEEIIVEKTKDGKPKISLDAENKLLDNTLIEFAQTSGLMDISKINISDKKSQLESILRTDLVTRGIIEKNDDITVLFDDLEKKLKDRQAKFKAEDKGREAVEDRMAGDAIVSIMQERNLTDPSKVSVEEVLYKYNETYLANTGHSLEETNSVLEGLAAQKGNGSQSPKTIELENMSARMSETIEAKKDKFSSKSKTKLNEKTSKAIKETLKRKKELELDKKILETQEKLENGTVQTVSDIISNENGGVNPISDGSLAVSTTDEIIKMLQIQTQLHKDKNNMIFAEQKIGVSKSEKVNAYRKSIEDGSLKSKADNVYDGSKRVTSQLGSDTTIREELVSTEITEILKRKKQKL